MSTRVVEKVDDWDEQSFSGGYGELHALADDEFSGVVRAGGAELYMTRGVVIGLRLGDIEEFEDASGTAFEAPADALPLLAIMQERSDEVRAKYYTEETSISKVDKTLSDGGFTGFIELSENVLSGDYYLVYHAGTSMSVAYVGESEKLLQDDEAFETADDEVGIYEVRPVDIEPVDIPEPAGGGATGSGSASEVDESANATDEPTSTDDSVPPQSDPSPGRDGADAGETEPDSQSQAGESSSAETQSGGAGRTADGDPGQTGAGTSQSGQASDGTGSTGGAPRTGDGQSAKRTDAEQRGESTDANQTAESTNAGAETTGQSKPTPDRRDTGQADGRKVNSGTERRQSGGASTDSGGGRQGRRTRESPQQGTDQHRSARGAQSRSKSSSQDLETKSIPSIDPSNTAVPDKTSAKKPTPKPEPSTQSSRPDTQNRSQEPAGQSPKAENHTPQQSAEQPGPAQSSQKATAATEQPQSGGEAAAGVDDDHIQELESELDAKDEEIEQLEAHLDEATDENQELETELEDLRAERDELAEEVERLETELTRLEDELGAATNAERRMTAGEALAGTDIFVRYSSKGKATLKKAHGGSTRKNDVTDNLMLEKHTQFDAHSVSVSGQSYDEFLEGTLEYQFVRWVVQDLLFEIRDTGHEKELRDLYDALPLVDRAELSGVVNVTYTEDGQEVQSQESFDVVLRDRMGTPLLVANLNDSREATTESMMEQLITAAERVGQATDGFAGAFLVTESFFDPGALEVASEATQGGLLSRDKRKSFVNLSRKQGYHLCLVEARSENFTLAVPEL